MPKLCIVTLGCPKNIVEGENIAGLLRESGWELTTDLLSADAALVHTCSFISDAKKESESVIGALCRLRKKGKLKKLAVTGCLVQSEGAGLQKKFKEVDLFTGTGSLNNLPDLLKNDRRFEMSKPGGLLESKAPRLLSSKIPSAYLRIAEGCNHRCSFCVIPGIRGRYKSRTVKSILAEAEGLAACGIKEINLIAQDTTLYGKDIYGKLMLPGLLNELSRIDGVRWIRLMYAYPGTVTGALINAIKNESKVCKYIDMPVQHVNDGILKLMGRSVGVKNVVKRLKKDIPGLTLRTTLITGFPGETEKIFNELADFVSEGWFDHLGVFEYNPLDGTPSSCYHGRVNAGKARERKKELMARQQLVVRARYRSLKGVKIESLVESVTDNNTGFGRAVFQAPEIDGGMIISGRCSHVRFVETEISGFKGYDLKGRVSRVLKNESCQ